MRDNSRDKQANAIRQSDVAPKQEEKPAERRWLQNALEDDEVYECLRLVRAREKAKSLADEAS